MTPKCCVLVWHHARWPVDPGVTTSPVTHKQNYEVRSTAKVMQLFCYTASTPNSDELTSRRSFVSPTALTTPVQPAVCCCVCFHFSLHFHQSEFHPAHDYKTLQTSWQTLSKCLLLLERKLVMGSCDCSSGQQSGAVRRQIKCWILHTVKRLLYTTKKNNSNGFMVVKGHQATRAQDAEQTCGPNRIIQPP